MADETQFPLPRLYTELAAWWPLLSRPEHYEEEARIFQHALLGFARGDVGDVLELGSGGGNNASHLEARFSMTLVDRAPGMVEVSRALNPRCEHHVGDMRDVRLDRTFDAVFLHDAISYLTTLEDLARTFETAALHCREGGVVLAVPDHTAESFRPATSHGGHDGEGRALRYLEWTVDADPSDLRYETDMVYVLHEGDRPPRIVHDRHVLGLFPERAWLETIAQAGFVPHAEPYRHSSFDPEQGHVFFVGVRR